MLENNETTESETETEMPPYLWDIIHQFLLGVNDKSLDFRQPHLKQSMKNIYGFIIFIYVFLIFLSVLLNFYVFIHIIYNKLYKDTTYSLIINNVLSDIAKSLIVLPLSLYVLLIYNWTLGELLCSFLPMIQDIPLHATTLTFLLMAWDRLRLVRCPTRARLPGVVCAAGTWFTAVCFVLPYPIYITYLDIGKYIESFKGVGICTVNLLENMQEYMRGIFLITYVAPLGTISYLYVKVSRELQSYQSSVVMYEVQGRSRTDSHSTNTDFRNSSRTEGDVSSQCSRVSDFEIGRFHYERREPDLDPIKEKRTQKYLVLMNTFYGICLCPLMVLRLARLTLLETYENSGHFDIVYTIFVWIGFLPTCTTPLIYIIWKMSRTSKQRLWSYFRWSNRKLQQSCETVTTGTGDTSLTKAKSPNQNENHRQIDVQRTSEFDWYRATYLDKCLKI